jgi:STE24 endopeptidase
LGDTLLSNFTPEEIEVVFAHEVGHHVHRHIQKLILGSGVYIAVAFWACDRILAWWLPNAGTAYDPANLPVHALPMLMLLLVVLETLSSPLRGAVSRYFERQCDWYALVRTRRVDAYVSAFTKLARQNKGDPDPHPLEVFWLHDHPPIRERLAMAERFAEKEQPQPT